MKRHFSTETAEKVSPTFFWGSSSDSFEVGKSLRGYDTESLAPPYDIALPLCAYMDFLFCPTYAYLRHIERVEPPTNWRAIWGRIVHLAFEDLLLKEFKIISKYNSDTNRDEMLNLCHEYVSGIIDRISLKFNSLFHHLRDEPPLDGLEKAMMRWCERFVDKALRAARAMGLEGSGLTRLLIPYRRVEVLYKAPELGVSGAVVDVVEGRSPLEIKAWKPRSAASFNAHRLQLALYALTMECSKGFNVDEGCLAYFFAVEHMLIPIGEGLRIWALKIRDRALEALTRERPPRTNRCRRGCSLYEFCPFSTQFDQKSFLTQKILPRRRADLWILIS